MKVKIVEVSKPEPKDVILVNLSGQGKSGYIVARMEDKK